MLVGLRGSGEQMEINYSFTPGEARESEGGTSGNWRVKEELKRREKKKGLVRDIPY